MKHAKKLASLLLALVMVLGLATTAFAAGDDGSITISNATVGHTYAVYKVFDLTYSGDAVSYTYTKTGNTNTLYDALTDTGSPFTLTPSTTVNVYNVSLKAGKTAADVSEFLTGIKDLLTQIGETQTATGSVVEFENLPYGYYYITSSLGAVVTIDSAKKDVTVIDKNQTPGDLYKSVATSADGDFAQTSTAAIGDTAYFKIQAYAPKYAGDELVATYKFFDTLADGFTYNEDLEVKLYDDELRMGQDYNVDVVGQQIIVYVSPKAIDNYPAEAILSITYSAKVDADAVYDNTNTVSMRWDVYPNDDNGDPDPGETPVEPSDPHYPPESKTDTYVFGFNVQKYKESVADENKLTGAKFKLYDAETAGNEIPVVKVSDGVYRVAVEGETGVEIEAGAAKIFGLDEKTYYLEETVAPNGYNILTERVPVKIKADTDEEDNVDDNGILNKTIDVINNTGTLLPSTGGMGTTLFYVLGGLLVVAAVVLLVAKKRMSQDER